MVTFLVKSFGVTVFSSADKEEAHMDYVSRLGRGELELWSVEGEGRVCRRLLCSRVRD